ncbi:hypothetical protein LCGC14_0557380 [marine sediment metagenome]|uniref:Uncharacterized protein n=1 Tax=marine sediment metagenome TaxID=412755 RepID=A0A0F9S6N7_9ZZZZ
MPTKTKIANVAMALLGQGRFTDVDTDTNEHAKWVRDLWDNSLDEALRAHPWNWATHRVSLGENLLLQSEAFDNTSWLKTNVTVTADQIRAPNGTLTADLLDDSGVMVEGTVVQFVAVPNNFESYTLSIYLREGTAAMTRLLLAFLSPWDVSTATYDSKSFNVATEELDPGVIFFKSDGTKMYVLGNTNDMVFQYSLSTAWEVSTATYDSKSFSVATEEPDPQGIFFKPDGTKLYVIGVANDTVYQYTLSTPWDVSTATYDSKSFNVATEENNPEGLFFKPDGMKLYVVGFINKTVHQYSLSTAWEVDVTWSSPPTVSAGTIEDIGDGLWRVSMTQANNGTGNKTLTVTISPAGAVPSATGTVYAWGVQLSRNTARIGYVKTTTAAIQAIYPLGFKYGWPLPTDWLREIDVNDGDLNYKIEGDYLFTDDPNPTVRYVRQITTVANFDALFAHALSVQLAMDLCQVITGSLKLMDMLEKKWNRALGQARTTDSQEDGEDKRLVPAWIAARRTGV